uniref:RHS repeat-associated core domain-containing protein n=1 Tax=Flavobacterium sp. TaxID=239 RepID=UPI004047CCAA
SSDSYRYGFNGQEKDDELKGEGNSYDFGNRMHDPRVGRWFKTDYYESKYASTSPYAFSLNNPIYLTDHVGDSVKVHITNIKVGEVKINLYSSSEIKKDASLKSKKKVVPVYKVTVTNQSTNNEYVFYYTRDAYRGQTDGTEKEVTFNVLNDGDKFLGKVKSRWKGTDNVLELRAFDNIGNQTIHGRNHYYHAYQAVTDQRSTNYCIFLLGFTYFGYSFASNFSIFFKNVWYYI